MGVWENSLCRDALSVVVSKHVKFEIDRCRIVAVYREHTEMHLHRQTLRQTVRNKNNILHNIDIYYRESGLAGIAHLVAAGVSHFCLNSVCSQFSSINLF